MCGIIAEFSDEPIHLPTLKQMNDKIFHRGPDGEGYLVAGSYSGEISNSKINLIDSDYNIGFAHRRLSIIDLSDAGHQPMNYKERYWIVYNGEVYNYLELRDELVNLGHDFKSYTDTEVILAAYDQWGRECLNRFNGMWAFIIFDVNTNTIFISRDRFGVKPLYYYQKPGLTLFASEIKAIIAHPKVNTSPNLKYCNDFIEYGCLEYQKETAFSDVFRFDFSSYWYGSTQSLFSEFKEERFWDYAVNTSDEPFNPEKAKKIAKDYYDLLSDAVRIRLRSDVPVGSALSGGLDSSSIVYLINQELKKIGKTEQQLTFSSVHRTPETSYCDESDYIDILSKLLDIDSRRIQPSTDEIPKYCEYIINANENPIDGTGMGSYFTYSLVSSSSVTVTLDGQGADEQQAGYLHHLIYYLASLPLNRAIIESFGFFRIPGAYKFIFLGLKFNLSKYIFGKNLTKKIVSFFMPRHAKVIFKPLNEILKEETFTGLINLIHYSDSRAMLFSLESRMPFMDYRLVEFTANIPACYKLHNGWTKFFARIAFSEKLPEKICWRKDKMGWPMPDDFWFNGPLKKWFWHTISKSKFLKSLDTKNIIEKELKNEIYSKSTKRLLSLAIWYYNFFEKKL